MGMIAWHGSFIKCFSGKDRKSEQSFAQLISYAKSIKDLPQGNALSDNLYIYYSSSVSVLLSFLCFALCKTNWILQYLLAHDRFPSTIMRLLSSFLAVLGFIASTVLPPAAALPSHAIQPLTYFPTNVSVHHSYHTHNDTGNYKYHAQNGTAVAKRQLGNIITCHGSKICQLGRDTRNSTAYKIFDQLTEQLKNGIDPGYTYTTE